MDYIKGLGITKEAGPTPQPEVYQLCGFWEVVFSQIIKN